MNELETFLIALIGELAQDLVPLIEKLIEGAATGRSPVDVLADESVVGIIPERWKIVLAMAAQKAKYGVTGGG